VEIRDYVRMLPLRPGTTPLKFAPDYEAWIVEAMRHGDNDSFWMDMGSSVVDHVREYKDVPVYHVTGWYDSWGSQVANLNYVELARAKKSPQRLIIGPWTHGGQGQSFSGIAEFGSDAAIDLNELRLRWYDRWLKGLENGVEKEAPVRIFVMGSGEPRKTSEGRLFVGGRWRDEREWPPKRAVDTPYYLHAEGALAPEKPGSSRPTSYRFDPHNPVPTLGGNVSSEGVLMPRGAQDQRCHPDHWLCDDRLPLSARSDVLVFQTAPLERDIEVTGRVIVKLWASSDGPDTDFTAKLIDVYPPNRDYPAGVDLNIGDSIVRARYRDSLTTPKMLTPGEPQEFTIEMYPTSLVFRRGHRIRLDISSSNFPRFDVNPNTGEPLGQQRRWRVAENTIYHDAQHSSRIVLPVVPPN
jgi:putative CocE/NonD family hydrolase